jgi:alpha-glucosidase
LEDNVDYREANVNRHLGIVAALGLLFSGISATAISVASPDGKVRFEFETNQGSPSTFQITFNSKAIIERSPFGIILDGVELSRGNAIAKDERYELKEQYPWRGVHAWATNHCRGARLHLSSYTLEARVFNDGVAFRHIIPGADPAGAGRIPDESTKFVLPAKTTIWVHDLGGHYEDTHDKRDLSDVQTGEWVAPPLTFKLPGNSGYASITEAALANYSGMALQAGGQRGFSVGLGHKHPISYPYRLRYSNDVDRVSKPAEIAGAITSAWRVVMIASDLNGLVNSDIIHNLCPPAGPKLFPKGFDTEWVKPGRAVWKYLDGGRNTFEEMKDFSRMAGELGFEYHVIEGFWSRWTDEQIKELVDYSRERGVGLFLWRHSRQLRTAEARDEFFKKLQRLGVAGAKIDFFDHEHKEVIDLYTTLLSEAAKHRVLVNFHGANKPTGESRTWPNELIREGVRGMESSRLQARAKHNTTLPFTRYLAGHGDYTPVHFGARRGDTTWAHQIATAAVFNEPLLTYGAHPTNLLANPALPMIKSIPAAWDETIVLPISEIGEVAAFARRSGDRWFLAVLNGPNPRTLKVPLTFLRRSTLEASLVRDDPAEPAAVKLEHTTVRPADSITLELVAGGGFIGRFQAAKQSASSFR